MFKALFKRKRNLKLVFGILIFPLFLLFYKSAILFFSNSEHKKFSRQLDFRKKELIFNRLWRNKNHENITALKINSNDFIMRPAMAKPKFYKPNGIGEFGVKEQLQDLSLNEKKEEEKFRAEYGINQFLSEKISLHRTLKDPRPPSCLENSPFNYTSLPSTSVIVVFYNEGMSTLLRTIYSILHNTDERLLNELILVDDFSNKPHLKKPFEEKIKNLPKVRLYRTERREGIVRSRLLGVSQSTGEVVAFVDCHCECTVGWLEPLLVSIRDNNSTLAVPVTDDIDSETFQYYYGAYNDPNIGGFRWNLDFHWRAMSATQRKNRKNFAEPIATPTISGGLFAINRKYFDKIGSYDKGMEVWGGENVEIAFRTWMCGGRVLIHPCSHIGHISRNILSYSRQSFWKNVGRAAAVWLHGHYERLFLTVVSASGQQAAPGDVTERKKLIERLKCHDFDWYLANVFPEKYVPEFRNGTFGVIKSRSKPVCVDRSGSAIILYPCHGLTNQFFEINSLGQLRNNDDCLWVKNKPQIRVSECPETGSPLPVEMKWKVTEDGHLMNVATNLCFEVVTVTDQPHQLKLNPCNSDLASQQWTFVDMSKTRQLWQN